MSQRVVGIEYAKQESLSASNELLQLAEQLQSYIAEYMYMLGANLSAALS